MAAKSGDTSSQDKQQFLPLGSLSTKYTNFNLNGNPELSIFPCSKSISVVSQYTRDQGKAKVAFFILGSKLSKYLNFKLFLRFFKNFLKEKF